ncbi:unnamed protein product [Anisakis simplex]|uniref:Aa_trans domain-containing protein n=1 Tax=Anisakis simplex TaxID=6269 RepID=A0A0M3JHC2_ANISI|nr:unnamed protein product [Anisakis simplex]
MKFQISLGIADTVAFVICPSANTSLTAVFGGAALGDILVIAIFMAVHTQSVQWKKSTARIGATLSHKYQVWSHFKQS